jgi:L-histidine Nalpha-methyltransferase / hercynylcysteine S-oxide synthase
MFCRHLSNDGVEETPPQGGSRNGFPCGKQNLNQEEIFVDLDGCNVGFQHWHPTSVTHKGDNLCGQADSGGLWGIARYWSFSILSS